MSTYGNYKAYQGASRHDGQNPASHVVDYRLQALVDALPDIFAGKDILDVGCNNGAISVHLALSFCPGAVTGIDIDPELIRKAKSHLSFRYSRTAPAGTAATDSDQQNNYFPISSVLRHGHRPYHEELDPSKFPRNVTFRCEDWAKSPVSEVGSYDLILALSMVKWVHLQYSDEGLRRFFAKVHSSLRSSGHFVLEPQEWASYERAAKKNKPLKENLQRLELRPESFGSILQEIGFSYLQKLDDSSLKRNILIFQKN